MFSRKHPEPALCATFLGNAFSQRDVPLGVPQNPHNQTVKIHLAPPASPGAALSGVLVGIQGRGSPHRGPWAQPPPVSRGLRVRQGLLLLRGGAPDALVRARRGREGEGGAWASLARRLHAATREARQGGAAEPRGEARTSDCVVLADGVHTSVYRARVFSRRHRGLYRITVGDTVSSLCRRAQDPHQHAEERVGVPRRRFWLRPTCRPPMGGRVPLCARRLRGERREGCLAQMPPAALGWG